MWDWTGWAAKQCVHLVLGALVLVSLLGAAAGATVSVSIRDAKTHGPLDAIVLLQGPVTVGDQSDVDGKLTFGALPAGRYTLTVRRAGYRPATRSFDIDPDAKIEIDVQLVSANELKEIAVVTVHSSSASGNSTIDSGSAIRILSPTLTYALGNEPGLTVLQNTEPGGTQTVSILGHDPTATAVSLDGIPLNVPGTAYNFGSLDSDVLDGLSIGYGPSGSFGGGAINLRTMEPTSSWQTGLDADVATFGRSFLSLSEQGTDGRLGVAYKQAFRSNASPLNDDVYKDSSGLDYLHDGDLITRGYALKLNYRIGNSDSLSVTSINSSSYTDLVCTLYTNPLPCGYGPGNYSTGTFHLSAIADSFFAGSTSWTASGYHYTSSTASNLWNLLLGGLRVPLGTSNQQVTDGFSVTGDIPVSSRDDFMIQASANSLSLNANDYSPSTSEASYQTLHSTNFSIKDRHRVSNHLQATLIGQVSSVTGTPGGLSLQANATLRNSDTQTTTFDGFVGRGINPDGSNTLLTPPALLEYNCTSQTATGSAPGDSISANSLAAVSATWQDQLPRGEVTLQLYDQDEKHGSLTALVNGTAFQPSLFFPGYFATAKQIYQLPTNCGHGSQINPNNFYFYTTVSNVDFLYQGMRLEAELPLERVISLHASIALNRVAAWSSDPRLKNPLSVFQAGRQVQGLPFASAYLSASYKPLTLTQPEVYVGVRYTGYDGPSLLPPNLVTDAAIVQRVDHGEISLLVNNVFNAYAGKFVTPRYAVPMFTAGGGTIAGIAVPNEPRTVTAAYTVGIGPNANVESSVSRSIGQETGASESLVSGYLLVKWPLTKPADPFLRNNGSACTPERARIADGVVTPFRALIAAIEANRSTVGYPETLPSSLLMPPGASYLRVGNSYVVALETSKVSSINAFLSCQLIHVGTQSNAQAAHLPYPPQASLRSVTFYYSPDIGFYYIQIPPEKGEAQKFRTYQLPSAPPSDPFAIVGGNACLPELKPVAQKLLSELQSFFARATPTSGSTEDWTITQHHAAKGFWYELKSDDLGTITSIINCGRVSSVGRKELEALGWGGVGSNEFNFSPSLGLYILSGP